MSHVNSGLCPKCHQIMDLYPGFSDDLRNWFVLMQAKFPNLHCSEAGRGRQKQNEDYNSGKSRAVWAESSHNWNCAIDTWWMVNGQYSLDRELYRKLEPEIPAYIVWYGAAGSVFYERPHFEIRAWKQLAAEGKIALVE